MKCLGLGAVIVCPALACAGVFDLPELAVAPSPDHAVDVAILHASQVGFWNARQNAQPAPWALPSGFAPRSVAWHPASDAFFLAGVQGAQSVILRVDRAGASWRAKQIFQSQREIRRLVIGPRPFGISYDEKKKDFIHAHRLFFGL